MQKLKIRAVNTNKTLLKIIKNPVTDHMPIDTIKVGTSTKGELVSMRKFATKLDQKKSVCYVIGAVSKGNPGLLNRNGMRICSRYHKSVELLTFSEQLRV